EGGIVQVLMPVLDRELTGQDRCPGADAIIEELALRFRRGDDQAFGLLYARYRAPLLRFVRRTTPDPSDLEELLQEIWLAVIRGRERYIGRARFVTYLFAYSADCDRLFRPNVTGDSAGSAL
ncbi:MAG TPA: sigma factor, partial [Steroidobacteraceae bacterium]|nr:sigma factor [Steroidobacteraceae bacterium]